MFSYCISLRPYLHIFIRWCTGGVAYLHICLHQLVNVHDMRSCLPLQAYTTLSDPFSRLKYNAQLQQALQDAEDDYTGELLFSAAQTDAACICLSLTLATCNASTLPLLWMADFQWSCFSVCRSASQQMASGSQDGQEYSPRRDSCSFCGTFYNAF